MKFIIKLKKVINISSFKICIITYSQPPIWMLFVKVIKLFWLESWAFTLTLSFKFTVVKPKSIKVDLGEQILEAFVPYLQSLFIEKV